MMNGETQDKIEARFRDLVPSRGECETVQGEAIRAISKIAYRCYNDGDNPTVDYGVETAGGCLVYLMQGKNIPINVRLSASVFRSDCETRGKNTVGDYESYEELQKSILVFSETDLIKNDDSMFADEYGDRAAKLWEVDFCIWCNEYEHECNCA